MTPRWLSRRQSGWGHTAERDTQKFLFVGGAVALLLVGGLAGYVTRSVTSHPPKQESYPVAEPSAAGVVKAPKSPEGAVQAVTAYVTGFPQVSLLNPTDQKKAIDDIVAPNADPNLKTDFQGVANAARAQLVGEGAFEHALTAKMIVAPASYKVDMLAPDSARVQIWFMTVLVDGNAKTAASSWATNDIKVQWTDHWRIVSYDAKVGPTPQLFGVTQDSSSFDEVVKVFNGFTAFRYATAPPAK